MDKIDSQTRSRVMSCVRSRNTAPELKVRRAIHLAGFRFRIHRTDLPGKPDVVLPKYKLAIQVNGCFWHGHGCKNFRPPNSNRRYWTQKIAGNVERDRLNRSKLLRLKWNLFTVWECQLEKGVLEIIKDLRHRRTAIKNARR